MNAPRRGGGESLGFFLLLAILWVGAFVAGRFGLLSPDVPDGPRRPPPGQPNPALQAEAADFWSRLEQVRPVFFTSRRSCPVCGTDYDQPAGDSRRDNRLGGVATDLMKLALSPPTEESGPPQLEPQGFDALVGSCPTCGATFADIDYINMKRADLWPGGGTGLKAAWKLKTLAPPLAGTDPAQWPPEVRNFMHYLTLREAALPDYELGYAALAGAYSANLSTYLGRPQRLPAAGLYALAAARFSAWLAGPEAAAKPQVASLVAMTLGELHRLLGRQSDSAAAFERARELGGLDPATLEIVDHLAGLNDGGDFGLHRAPLKDQQGSEFPAPPVGWYLDLMLPAVNGELQVTRGEWAELDEPAAVEAELIKRLAE